MKKKVLSVLLSMAMVAGVITGCGGAAQSAADQLEAEGVTEIPHTEATTEATTEAKTEEKKNDKKSGKATITVTSGMSSEDVSQLLENAGLVKSATEFNTWLIQKGYDSQLHIGEFEIESGASNEEIAKTLMTQGK